MELRQLNTLVTIAKVGNFTQAGEILGYAQSTVTTQIQLLEQELNTKLFERLGKNVALTFQGTKFLTYAQQILRLTAEAQQAVAVGDTLKGSLTIGSVESLCVTLLPKIVKEFRHRYPEVEISLKLGNCQEFNKLLWENKLDIAFFLDREIKLTDLTVAFSQSEPMVFLAAPDHPLTTKPSITPEDLSGQPLILTGNGCGYRTVLENILAQTGVRLITAMETGSIQAIKQFTIGGLGITVLPLSAVNEDVQLQRLTILPWKGPDFKMLTQVVHHKDKWISPPLQAFLDLVKEF